MKKNWVLAALLAAALWLLGGCGMQIEERPAADISQIDIDPGAQAPLEDVYAAEEETVILYFLEEEGVSLVPTPRSVRMENGMSAPEAALYALLEGPLQQETGVYWPQAASTAAEAAFELSGGTATVNLSARMRELPQEQIFAVRQAVANTLTEFSGISYVNVLVGGREEGLDLGASMPVGTLSRVSDTDTGAQYARLEEQRQQDAAVVRTATLYFPSQDGTLLIPEVRSVALDEAEPIECLYQLLQEFGKGAGSPYASAQTPAPLEYIMEMPDIVRTEDGAYRAIELQLDGRLKDELAEQGLTLGIYIAALTDTLMGFVPGVEGVRVSMDGVQLTALDGRDTPDGEPVIFAQTLAARADFAHYVGAPCTLYTPDGEGKLDKAARIIEQSRRNSPRETLCAQLHLLQEAGLLNDALGMEDILAVSVREEDILVNLSAAFADALAQLEPEEERAAVYAMVNTLTEGRKQQSVRFFFDGEQRQTLAGGLEMRGCLVRNPGMVVE